MTGLPYNIDDEAEGATEAMEPRRGARVRELHEVEEFVSDDDESDHGGWIWRKTLISSLMMMV